MRNTNDNIDDLWSDDEDTTEVYDSTAVVNDNPTMGMDMENPEPDADSEEVEFFKTETRNRGLRSRETIEPIELESKWDKYKT